MLNKLILISSLLVSFINYSQINATTDTGVKVVLNNDGTWNEIKEDNNEDDKFTNYVFMGTERLKATEAEYIRYDLFGGGASTSVQIALKDNKKMIIFWQSQIGSFYHKVWEGDVYIYLQDGNSIKLIDRNMNGINAVANLKNGGNSYQRYSAHYLTEKEFEMLRNSDLSAISYASGDFNVGRLILEVLKNKDAIKKQL